MLSPEMKDLITCLRLLDLSIEESQTICLLMNGRPEETDDLTNYAAENKATYQEILQKAMELVGNPLLIKE